MAKLKLALIAIRTWKIQNSGLFSFCIYTLLFALLLL